MCRQREESTPHVKTSCADHKALCYRDNVQDTASVQRRRNALFPSGPGGLPRDSTAAQTPRWHRSRRSGKTTTVVHQWKLLQLNSRRVASRLPRITDDTPFPVILLENRHRMQTRKKRLLARTWQKITAVAGSKICVQMSVSG